MTSADLFVAMDDTEVDNLMRRAIERGDHTAIEACKAELFERGYLVLVYHQPWVPHYETVAMTLFFGAVSASVLWGIAWLVFRGRC